MNVAENIGFGLKLRGLKSSELNAKVKAAADKLDLGHLLKRKPSQLSGGQRQRVAMGRVLVREPRVFLFDEPLSNLDASLRVQMRSELSALHREVGTTSVYVTHDQIEAMTLGTRIAVLNHGELQQVAPPLEPSIDPRTSLSRVLWGSHDEFLDGKIERRGNELGSYPAADSFLHQPSKATQRVKAHRLAFVQAVCNSTSPARYLSGTVEAR